MVSLLARYVEWSSQYLHPGLHLEIWVRVTWQPNVPVRVQEGNLGDEDRKRIVGPNLSTDCKLCERIQSSVPTRTDFWTFVRIFFLIDHFYTLLFHSLFKVEFDIDHFVLGEHWER